MRLGHELRPRHLAVIFAGLFGAVTAAAYTYARGTTVAWYAGFPSFAVYGMTFLGSLVLLVGIGLFAAFLAKLPPPRADDGGAKGLGARLGNPTAHPRGAGGPNARISDEELEDFLEAVAEADRPPEWQSDPKEMEVRVITEELARVQSALVRIESGTGEAIAADAARGRTGRIVLSVLGPAVVAIVFLGVSAMMLPGIEYFTRSNYVLSNALVLAISYNWIGLGAYAVASMIVALRQASQPIEPEDAMRSEAAAPSAIGHPAARAVVPTAPKSAASTPVRRVL